VISPKTRDKEEVKEISRKSNKGRSLNYSSQPIANDDLQIYLCSVVLTAPRKCRPLETRLSRPRIRPMLELVLLLDVPQSGLGFGHKPQSIKSASPRQVHVVGSRPNRALAVV
jgi:hypothetical protein